MTNQARNPFLALLKLEVLRSATIYGNPLALILWMSSMCSILTHILHILHGLHLLLHLLLCCVLLHGVFLAILPELERDVHRKPFSLSES